MTVTGAIVMLAMIWFAVLFMVLPWRARTQGEAGEVVAGTPASAPAEAHLGRKLRLTSIIAVAVWLPACAVIVSGAISVRDIDIFNRMGPPATTTTPGDGRGG